MASDSLVVATENAPPSQPNRASLSTATSFEVLGPAAPGLCAKGGDVARIRHGSRVSIWHPACADRYLAAMADPPVKVPELRPDALDEHGAPLAAHTSPSSNSEGLSPA
jgi:hypothetical protein